MSRLPIFIALALVACTTAPASAERPESRPSDVRPELRVQLGHAGGTTFVYVVGVAFSADGSLVATGGTDATARLWDATSGRELRTFGADGDMIGAVSLSGDGRLLATVDFSGAGRLWDTATGAEIHRFDEEVGSAEFAPNGELLVAGPSGLAVFDPATKRARLRLEGATGLVAQPEGQIVALCQDGSIGAWDTATGGEVRRSPASLVPDDAHAVALSPDGRFVAVDGPENAIILRSAETGAEVRRFVGHTSEPLGAAFSPDGRLLATHGEMSDTTVRVWEVATGKQLLRFGPDLVRVTSCTFAPDGRTLVVANQVGDVRSWKVGTGTEAGRYEGRAEVAWPAALSPDSRYLATVGTRATTIWSLETGAVVRRASNWDEEKEISKDEGQLVLTSDGRCALTERAGAPPELWRPPAGSTLERYVAGKLLRTFLLSPDRAFAVTLDSAPTPDGERDEVRLWSATDGRAMANFEASFVTMSPDSHRLLLVGSTGVEILDLQAPNRRRRLASVPAEGRFALSPDGRTLAQMFGDGVALWDLEQETMLRRLEPELADATSIAFAADGDRVVAGGRDAAVVWETQTGRVVRRFEAPERSSTAFATISPDGAYILTGGAGPARLWNLETGALVCMLVTFQDGSWVVADTAGRFDTDDLESSTGLHWVVPDDPYTALPVEIFLRDYYEPRLLPRLLAGDGFAPVRDLQSLNRVQPSVRITSVEPVAGQPDLVTVRVEVTEVRRAVRRGRGTIVERSGVHDVRLFRDGQLVGYAPAVDGAVPLDPRTGSKELTFERIRIPRLEGLKKVEFSAYAFNVDRVKSPTARLEYRLASALEPVKGTAFVVSIGVNDYDDPTLRLRYAANDARLAERLLVESLRRTGDFDAVVPILLLSEGSERHATKPVIETVLGALAGRSRNEQLLERVENAGRLRAARPEDLVLISFAGHGYADGRGGFYLVPSDVGADARTRMAEVGSARRIDLEGSGGGLGVLSRCISSAELALWLRDVDAGEMALVVDACQSGALAGENFKPGPMGSRGLGQLAYDKGMRVLAATQADDVALELGELEHGVVSYVLLEEGLADRRADRSPADGVLLLSEWLRYAVERVPVFFAEIAARDDTAPSPDAPRLLVQEDETRPRPPQRPALFDFSKRRDVVVAE